MRSWKGRALCCLIITNIQSPAVENSLCTVTLIPVQIVIIHNSVRAQGFVLGNETDYGPSYFRWSAHLLVLEFSAPVH